MAETAIQRLKRLAAEKKAAAAPVATPAPAPEETKAEEVKDAYIEDTSVRSISSGDSVQPVHSANQQVAVLDSSDSYSRDGVSDNVSPVQLTPSITLSKSSRNHPLVREMEELEAALEQNVPGFVTILRDIHKKLAEDPLTVTLLSLEERGTIVKGMTRHANVTIATKAVKSTSRSKKVAVTASDL